MTIQQLSQEIGIGIDTLRIWERRYGFPVPGRDARGHRSYSQDQVEALRLVKNLMSYGLRPGKIFTLTDEQRRELLKSRLDQGRPSDQRLQRLIAELTPQQIAEELSDRREKLGLNRFILEFAVPLLQLLDHSWATGTISIAREHLLSDQLENLLKAEFSAPAPAEQPQVLFLTLSGERHKLGLLLAAATFHSAGVDCIWLNEELPLSEVPRLAQELAVAGVALSFSSHYLPRQAKQDLSSLRKQLDQKIKLIAGGHAVQQLTSLPNLLICTDLQLVPQLVRRHFKNHRL